MDSCSEKTPKKQYNLRKRKKTSFKKNYKINEESDDSDSDYEPGETDTDESMLELDIEEPPKKEERVSMNDIRSIIAELYPSKYTNQRLKELKAVDNKKKKNKKKEK